MNVTPDQLELWTKIVVFGSTVAGVCYTMYKTLFPIVKNKTVQGYEYTKKVVNIVNSVDEIHKLIKQELSPNGGSSLKDTVNNINSQVHILGNKQRAQLSQMEHPVWESDAFGNCIWANLAYVKLLNTDFDRVKNYGWLSFVSSDERDEVVNEWRNSIKDKRHFNMEYLLVNSEGKEVNVLAEATPIFDNKGNLTGYIGVIKCMTVS